MQDAAWAIGLFGGIPAALIFLFWWIRRWDWRGPPTEPAFRRPVGSGTGHQLGFTPAATIKAANWAANIKAPAWMETRPEHLSSEGPRDTLATVPVVYALNGCRDY